MILLSLGLPCNNNPPSPPEGAFTWIRYDSVKYKCPHGFEFEGTGSDIWEAVCPTTRKWKEKRTPDCVRKSRLK